MNHHMIPTLLEDKPNIIIVHVAINGVLNRCDQDQIIKNIQQICITWKNSNVNQVIIPGIVSCKRADDETFQNEKNVSIKILIWHMVSETVKKQGRKRFYLSCNYFCTLSFLLKILLLFKLKNPHA